MVLYNLSTKNSVGNSILKAPRLITHRKYLKDVEENIQNFYQKAALLKEKLGLILLQLAPHTPYNPENLRAALSAFPDPGKVAVEFRHDQWFKEEIYALLKELGVTLCTADSPRTDLLPKVTSKNAYLRLHGAKKWYDYKYSKKELQDLAHLIKNIQTRGAENIYIFFNNDANANAPKNAIDLIKILM